MVVVTQTGCGDDSTAPSPNVDQSLVGSWVNLTPVADFTGVLCTDFDMRLVLHEEGQFDWYIVDSSPVEQCEAVTFTKYSGVWRTREGAIVFTPPPPPLAVQEPRWSCPTSWHGGELVLGPFVFELE